VTYLGLLVRIPAHTHVAHMCFPHTHTHTQSTRAPHNAAHNAHTLTHHVRVGENVPTHEHFAKERLLRDERHSEISASKRVNNATHTARTHSTHTQDQHVPNVDGAVVLRPILPESARKSVRSAIISLSALYLAVLDAVAQHDHNYNRVSGTQHNTHDTASLTR
jgi:hypothetical protein